jgi:ribose 5-phosphate isomerase B
VCPDESDHLGAMGDVEAGRAGSGRAVSASAVALGADHAGWELKEALKSWLIDHGYEVLDFGTHSPDPVDYPDYAAQVGEAVASSKVERGVLVCGTGIGMAIAANKVPGVRAAVCPDVYAARMSREHNDANVLALGRRLLGAADAVDILRTWLETSFADGRHRRRVDKIAAIEQRHGARDGLDLGRGEGGHRRLA